MGAELDTMHPEPEFAVRAGGPEVTTLADLRRALLDVLRWQRGTDAPDLMRRAMRLLKKPAKYRRLVSLDHHDHSTRGERP